MNQSNNLLNEILDHPYWYHRIPLDKDLYTPGQFQTDPHHWDQLRLPHTLAGKSFLDIGAFHGLHSFEAEKRGATDILATDLWFGEGSKKGFDLVREYKKSKVVGREMDVNDISVESVGYFDVVLCSGLIYHVQDPFMAIKNAVSVAKEIVVIESAITKKLPSCPAMEFAKAIGPTNIRWIPNLECMKEMMLAAGCNNVEAHTYSPSTHDSIDIPQILLGEITKNTPLYRDHELLHEIDSVELGTECLILMKLGKSTKIATKTNTEEKGISGWIEGSSISLLEGKNFNHHKTKSLRSRIINYYVSNGLNKTLGIGSAYFASRNTGSRGVVVGYK